MEENKDMPKGVIKIDDHYVITVQQIGYALGKVFTTKKGARRVKAIAYSGSITQCLVNYIKEAVHDDLMSDADISLDEALEQLYNAVERCSTIIRDAIPSIQIIDGDDRQSASLISIL